MLRKTKTFQSIFISRRFTTTSVNLDNELQKAKPFSSIPSISMLNLIISSLPGGKLYNASMKEFHKSFRAEYGNVVKFPGFLGRPSIVFAYDANEYEKIYRAEGQWPRRLAFDSLDYYRKTKRPDIYNEFLGLTQSQGEDWQRMRTIVNPILMQPKTMKLYCPQVDAIAKEFVQIMKNLRNEKSEMPADFGTYINSWSLESVTTIALERRLNIMDGSSKDEKAKELIKQIRLFFEYTFEYEAKLSIWRYYHTKGFKDLLQVYDALTNLILHYIDLAIKEIEVKTSSEDQEEGILRKLLKIDKKAAIVMVYDMLMAGVDTTATATINILYCLAKNPDKQEILRKELMGILTDKNTVLTAENMKNMPYLRASIKESLRIQPVIAGTGRQIGNDIVISGYHIPTDTHILMPPLFELVNPNQYPEPLKFIPERWLRDNDDPKCPHAKTANPFTFLPFGFGSRMCIGKRLAELEMETLISNIIRNFKLEWHHEDLKVKATFVNIPISELKFKVIDVE